MLRIGLKGESRKVVVAGDSAAAQHSGDLDVLSTPSLIALMEHAAFRAVEAELPAGSTTVGISINAEHIAATPIGMQVWAEAEVVAFDGRGITFDITAYDETGKIGTARHKRFAVVKEKFMGRVNAKLSPPQGPPG